MFLVQPKAGMAEQGRPPRKKEGSAKKSRPQGTNEAMAKKEKELTQQPSEESDISVSPEGLVFTIKGNDYPAYWDGGIPSEAFDHETFLGRSLVAVSQEQVELQLKLQEKEAETAKLRQDLFKALAKKEKDSQQLQQIQEKYDLLAKEKQLNNILASVESAAQKKLLADESFAKLFAKGSCQSFVMSVDIRRSTDLMLKAVKPSEFAVFIKGLCDRLRSAILRNHGVFDKFTGDGVLSFFPDFFSGDDAGFLAVNAAAECHRIFKETYEAHLHCFTTARSDAGLGIGIDFGAVDLVTNLGGLTVVGPPVVYACRLAFAPAGTTQLNQQAYRVIFDKYSAYCSFKRAEIPIKNEGSFWAYEVSLNDKPFKPAEPPWLAAVDSAKEKGVAAK